MLPLNSLWLINCHVSKVLNGFALLRGCPRTPSKRGRLNFLPAGQYFNANLAYLAHASTLEAKVQGRPAGRHIRAAIHMESSTAPRAVYWSRTKGC